VCAVPLIIISENNEQNGESVALKEGLLHIESTGPAFEIHKKKVMDDFEQFKQQQHQAQKKMRDEFEQYKKQTQRDFIEYRRNFTLQPNRVISLSGYRVDETAMSEADNVDFLPGREVWPFTVFVGWGEARTPASFPFK